MQKQTVMKVELQNRIRPRHYDFAPSHEEVSPCIWPVKTWKLFITGGKFLIMKCHEEVSLSSWPEN